MELNKNSRVQTLLTLVEVLVNQFWVAFLQDDFDKEFHLKWNYIIRSYKKLLSSYIEKVAFFSWSKADGLFLC